VVYADLHEPWAGNPPEAPFCNRCGTSFAAAGAVPQQLKNITALFADVTGSAHLGERLDPEAVHRVIDRYFELAGRVITRFGSWAA
jgi:class 3 adenylate cyclase